MCESLGHEQVRREERSFGGDLLAVICGACQNPISIVCPACKSETADLRKHFKDKVPCWKKADGAGHREWQRRQDAR
jgi:hypothetical protein